MKRDFIFILACSGSKNKNVERCAAKDMYTGRSFKSGRQMAERAGAPFIILSAKYGFVEPDDVIEKYDQRFNNTKAGRFDAWHTLPEKYRDAIGFTIGGDAYFKTAPMRFARLYRAVRWRLEAEMKRLADAPDEILHRIAEHRAAVEEQFNDAAHVTQEELRDDHGLHRYHSSAQAREERPVEELRIVARAMYSNFEIVRFANGVIRILRDGVVQREIVKDILRPIAAEVGVELFNSKGIVKNTQTLGADVIRALKARFCFD